MNKCFCNNEFRSDSSAVVLVVRVLEGKVGIFREDKGRGRKLRVTSNDELICSLTGESVYIYNCDFAVSKSSLKAKEALGIVSVLIQDPDGHQRSGSY